MSEAARLIGSAPILLVADVVASANHYRDRLGFQYERFWGEPAGFCILWRDGLHLMLSQVEDRSQIVPHYEVVPKMWNERFCQCASAARVDMISRSRRAT